MRTLARDQCPGRHGVSLYLFCPVLEHLPKAIARLSSILVCLCGSKRNDDLPILSYLPCKSDLKRGS